jgi:hypothetical protein
MSITALHFLTPPEADRAMTPDAVAAEITNGTKDRLWVIRRVPRDCRVRVRTRPPLFWESRVRAWWSGRGAP